MTSASRRLGWFALALLIVGCSGSWMWAQWIITGQRLVQREAVTVAAVVDSAAEQDSTALIDVNMRRSRQVQAHAHALNLCVLLITSALLLQHSRFSESARRRLAFILIVGVMVYPIGLIIDAVRGGMVSHGLALLGATAVVAGFVGLVFDRWRPHRDGERAGS